MFDAVDEALRKLLVREIPIRSNEIEIAFEQPKREWSARLNRPTLNVFLHDLRENVNLRNEYRPRPQPSRDPRTVSLSRPEVRIDLHYMITAWASDSDDEHRLLARALTALVRTPEMPDELLGELRQTQRKPIQIYVAQYDSHLNPADIWSVLDNELRPALTCRVTVLIDPFVAPEVPVVRSRQLVVGQLAETSFRRQSAAGPVRFVGSPRNIAVESMPDSPAALNGEQREYWTVGGRIEGISEETPVQVVLRETGQDVPVAADGRFVIGNLVAGRYTLIIRTNEVEQEETLEVPSADYTVAI